VDQTRRSDIGRPAEQIVALPAWRLDDDPSDQTIAAAGGGQSGRADARPLRAIVPPPSARVSKARPCTHRPSGRWNTYEVFPSMTSLPYCTDSTWLIKAVLPYPSSATTSGCGSPTPRRYSPRGSVQRTTKSTRTTSLPSLMTTTSSRPSISRRTRCPWPLHPIPTRPSCRPYFLKKLSSPSQSPCHHLWGAGLWPFPCRHTRTRQAWPKRGNHLTHFRSGKAPKSRPCRCLCRPRPPGSGGTPPPKERAQQFRPGLQPPLTECKPLINDYEYFCSPFGRSIPSLTT
jgi:hypothetical protein